MKSQRKTNHKREQRIERRREKRELKRKGSDYSFADTFQLPNSAKKEVAPLRAYTEAQEAYLNSIDNNIITFAVGPAGTGKTFIAGAYAAQLLKDGKIDRIIITRPGVEAGESFGFLPGELEEKYLPYIEPFKDVLDERLGKSQVTYFLAHKVIIASPLGFMRGKSFKNCMIILDEAQNATPTQMKLFLTRIGENCKVVVDGDISQKDISGTSGLADAIDRLRKIGSVGVVEFGIEDIVRSGICKDIIKAYAA